MRTIVKVLKDTSPRRALCDRLEISVQYASGITKGKRIGGTETLVRIADRLGLSNEELGASAREMYPADTTQADTSPAVTDAA